MLYLYDIALKAHIKKVYEYTYLSEKTLLFKTIRQGLEKKDANLKLPVIGIHRIDNNWDSDRRNFAEFNSGVPRMFTQANNSITNVKGINIGMQYQVDIIAKTQKDCDDMLADFLMYISENPTILIQHKGLEFEFNVDIMDMTLSTDYGSFSDKGELHNQTVTLSVPEARILFTKDAKIFKDILIDLNMTEGQDSDPIENRDIVATELIRVTRDL